MVAAAAADARRPSLDGVAEEAPSVRPDAPAAACTSSYRRNIRCILGVGLFNQAATSVTLGPLFDAFLLELGGASGNVLVGAVESTRGMLQLAAAWPLGWLSDRASRGSGSRVSLVRWNLPLWTLGLAVVIVGVMLAGTRWDHGHLAVVLIFAGVSLFAPGAVCWQTSAQVMVAESVEPEKRSGELAKLTSTNMFATSLGPLMQVGLLLGLRQNRWDNALLRWVVSSGCLLWPGVVLCTLALRRLEPLEKATGRGAGGGSSFSDEELDRRVCGAKVRWWLAGTLEVQAVVTAIGAGMTVKYFPLFFKSDYHFSPIAICILNVVLPVCMSATVQAGVAISRRIGRLRASLLVHFLGTLCLWTMTYCRSLPLVLPIFVLRGALMNSKAPLTRSLIMDCVAMEMRGRWASIMSLTRFTWSGSAALGGYIADASGDYRVTFAVTASIYTFSFLLMVPLLLVCPADGPARAAADAPSAQPTPAAPGGAAGAAAPTGAAAAAAPLLDEDTPRRRC